MTPTCVRRLCLLGGSALLLSVSASVGVAQAGTVILVRHAEKAAPSGDPELSARGIDRSMALARALRAYPLDLIVTSQYRRTWLTAQPVATAQGLPLESITLAGDATTDARRVVEVLGRLRSNATALVVGHSNTLGPIIAALGGPTLPDLCDEDYSTLFVVTRSPGDSTARLLIASYGAPSMPRADSCAPNQ